MWREFLKSLIKFSWKGRTNYRTNFKKTGITADGNENIGGPMSSNGLIYILGINKKL
jgi:hypothetical protein